MEKSYALRDDSEFLVPSLQRVLDTALGVNDNNSYVPVASVKSFSKPKPSLLKPPPIFCISGIATAPPAFEAAPILNSNISTAKELLVIDGEAEQKVSH